MAANFHLQFNHVVNGVSNQVKIFNPQANVVYLEFGPEDPSLEIGIRDYPNNKLELSFPSPQDREFWVNSFTTAVDNVSNLTGPITLPDTNIVTSITTTTSTSTTTTTTAAPTTTTTSSTTTTTTSATTTTSTSTTTTLAPPTFSYTFNPVTGTSDFLTIKKNSITILTVTGAGAGSIPVVAGDVMQLIASQAGGRHISYALDVTDPSAILTTTTGSTTSTSTPSLSMPSTTLLAAYTYAVTFNTYP
jgi:hypothetical protein